MWATALRRCVIASPGRVLVSADYVGMESYLTGYFAEDPVYMNLSTMNIYAYVVAKYKKWELPDESDNEALRKALKEYKARAKDLVEPGETRTLYDKFKCIVLGIGYGEGRDTLFYSNPGLFRDLAEAGALREFVLNTFPKVKAWQRHIVDAAGRDKKLINPFGYVRWFLDCPGSDSSRAMAQFPQSTGAAIIKEVMLQADATLLSDWLILQIHDELVWDVPIAQEREAVKVIHDLMTQPWPQLNGHSIAVSMKRGQNLADMEDL
jgi:DNA polymerase I-like protein with 3'-5' exonuclease and polymerase domains